MTMSGAYMRPSALKLALRFRRISQHFPPFDVVF